MVDIDPENVSQIRDLATALQDLSAEMSNAFGSAKKNISSTTNATKQWQEMLAAAVVQFKDLPGHITNANDLWKEMTQNTELAQKIQDKMISSFERHLDDREDLVKIVKDHVDLAKRIEVHQEETNVKMLDANKLAKDLGTLIRNPSQGMEMLLGKMGQLPQKIGDATQETGSLTKGLAKVGKDGLQKIIGPAKALFASGGLFLVGIAAVTLAFAALFMLVKNYYNWLDKEVMPAQAKFNKEIGNTGEGVGKLKGQMSGVGAEFQLLGYSFEEGASLVRGFARSFKEVDIDKKELTLAKNLIAVVGLTAEETGKMALQFKKQSGNVEAMEAAFTVAEKGARAYGIPVNDVLRDLGGSPEVLARFGTKSSLAFAEATAKANSYGLSIKDVNKAFGDQFDSFEKSAEAGANLNAIFGTNINSLELMMETDPTKRMEMVRKQLISNGKEWENLSNFEKNVIAENLGVEKSQAALILSSEKERKKLEQKAAAQKAVEQTQAKWNKGIHQIKKTLIAWGAEVDAVMRKTTKFIFELLGFKAPGKEISDITGLVTEGFRWLGKTIDDWTGQLKGSYEEAGTFVKILKIVQSTSGFVWDVFNTGYKVIKKLVSIIGEALAKFDEFAGLSKKLKPVGDFFSGIFDDADKGFSNMGKSMKETSSWLDSTKASHIWEALKSDPETPKAKAKVSPAKLRNRDRINERNQGAARRAPGQQQTKTEETINVNLVVDGRKWADHTVRRSKF